MSVGFGLHADIDAVFAAWECKTLLLRREPDEIIILPSGQRYERANRFDKFFHFDTGGIYNPATGDLDHHLIPKDHPQSGKCAAVLTMDFIEEQIGRQSDEYRTIAQFAQAVDKERWRGWADKYNLYAQDSYSAPVLAKLPETIGPANRSKKVPKKNIVITIETTIESYLEKRRESKGFRDWYFANKTKGIAKIEENTPFKVSADVSASVPALVISECPYDSGDFRYLVNHYLKMYSLIIARYVQKDERGELRVRYGVNKPDWLHQLDLQQKYRILGTTFPRHADDNDKLFLHNNGLYMYMNQVPPGFTFEEWVNIILKKDEK
jgi:hypothetical protein